MPAPRDHVDAAHFESWPDLRHEDWKDGCETLHRWLQIAGKIRLSKSPWINHAWHATLYLTPRGLTTSLIHDRHQTFAIDFDFIDHTLVLQTSEGFVERIPLKAESVASFHERCFSALGKLGIHAKISEIPNELPDTFRLDQDDLHRSYDPEFTSRYWKVMLQVERVMQIFRSRFLGKVSPIHLFWGSMDLAITRYSSRRAPEHPGGVPHLPDLVTREAYSHEVSSCGFWPGNEQYPHAAFYSYAYPSPAGLETASILPDGAFWSEKLREFILPYDVVRSSSDPTSTLLDFFQTTYDAAANLGNWDRSSLEESPYLEKLQEIHGPLSDSLPPEGI